MSLFGVGDRVRVRGARPPGHMRTPWFVRGRAGVVSRQLGEYGNPEELAFGRDGLPKLPLYEVRFRQNDLWAQYQGAETDTIDVDLYESWLEPAET